jgi:hypothetical protein
VDVQLTGPFESTGLVPRAPLQVVLLYTATDAIVDNPGILTVYVDPDAPLETDEQGHLTICFRINETSQENGK